MREREKQITALLLEACDNETIAKKLGIPKRTVKLYLARLFVKYNIVSGVKRVKLAVLLYRQQQANQLIPNSDPCQVQTQQAREASKRSPLANDNVRQLPSVVGNRQSRFVSSDRGR